MQQCWKTDTDSHHAGQPCNNVSTLAQVLDRLLTLLGTASATATYNVDSCLAEVEDLLSYCNDILSTGVYHTKLKSALHRRSSHMLNLLCIARSVM